MIQRQVSFVEAIKMAIVQNYANFNGRSSRSEYWWYVLFTFILGVAVSAIFGTKTAGMIISGIISLALFVPGIAICVRRLHDIGKSGWWWLIGFIPLVGAIILIVWFCKESMPMANRWGNQPNMVG